MRCPRVPPSWTNGSNIWLIFSGRIPIPVSVMLKISVPCPASSAKRNAAEIVTPPGMGEFQGVAREVQQNLFDAQVIQIESRRQIGVRHLQGKILFHGFLLEHSDDFQNQPLDVNGPAIQFHLIRFKLGEIQNVIDQVQQRIAREVDGTEIFLPLLRFDIRPLQQFAEADDRIQRRPEFMAYRGQEIALGPVRRTGLLQCLPQFFLLFGQFGDVLNHAADFPFAVDFID